MESTKTVSKFYFITPQPELQEAEENSQDWHDRFFMTEPEHDTVPVYVEGWLMVTLWADDYSLESAL